MKQDIKQVVTQRPGVKQVVTQKLGLVEQEVNQIVTQNLGLVEQEVNQIGTQKPGVAPRDLQVEDNETHTSFRAISLLPQVCTVPYLANLFTQKKCFQGRGWAQRAPEKGQNLW